MRSTPRQQQIVEGDIATQTERVLENLKGIVEAAGSSIQHVVKTTVFLADMNDFAAMNEVYGRYFIVASAGTLDCRGRAAATERPCRNRPHRVALNYRRVSK